MNRGHWSQSTTVSTEKFLPGTKLRMALLTPRAESRKKKTTPGLHQKILHFNLRIRPELQACKRQYIANAMQVYGTTVTALGQNKRE